MITYNHEAFISEAIEGVLMQKTDFPVELVIGDDCSTDRTPSICRQYQERYPQAVRLIEQPENVGVSENFRRSLNSCRGKYVAICEGDDYWTDPDKLQKQVDFLAANPDYSICFHNCALVFDDENEPSRLLSSGEDVDYSFDDFITRRVVAGPVAMLFRRSLLPTFPEGFIVFDWVIFLIMSHGGKVRFINDVTSVYRRHAENWTNVFSVRKAEFLLSVTQQCKDYFAPAYGDVFDKWLSHCYADVCFTSFREGNFEKFSENYEKCEKYWDLLETRKRRALVVRKALLASPILANIYNAFQIHTRKYKPV